VFSRKAGSRLRCPSQSLGLYRGSVQDGGTACTACTFPGNIHRTNFARILLAVVFLIPLRLFVIIPCHIETFRLITVVAPNADMLHIAHVEDCAYTLQVKPCCLPSRDRSFAIAGRWHSALSLSSSCPTRGILPFNNSTSSTFPNFQLANPALLFQEVSCSRTSDSHQCSRRRPPRLF